MMVCGQVGRLVAFADIANSLTRVESRRLKDSQNLSLLFTVCGL
jgi:hypothetical protein